MAKEPNQWKLGIGAQVDQATVNNAVLTATDLITGAAAGTDATGILLRDVEDISLTINRLADDLGSSPGSKSRIGSALQSSEPVLSFTIDMMGNRTTATPSSGEYNLDEYMQRILAGARMTQGTPTGSETPYTLDAAQEYQSIKVWRSTESWTLVGCAFDLSWAFVAGEKARMTVTVFARSVIHDDTEVFPTNDVATAFGNQAGAPPIFQLAGAQADSVTRGMQSATVTLLHEREEIGDSNVAGGIINSEGQRTAGLTADWYVDDTADDFANLEEDLPLSGAGPLRLFTFNLGQAAGAADTINAFAFDFQNFEIDSLDEVNNGDNAVRTITGHSVVAGASGIGSAAEGEFQVVSI